MPAHGFAGGLQGGQDLFGLGAGAVMRGEVEIEEFRGLGRQLAKVAVEDQGVQGFGFHGSVRGFGVEARAHRRDGVVEAGADGADGDAEHEGGLLIGARRNAEDDQYYWRITPWVMPCYTGVPPRADHPMHGHFWVPIDDHNCWAWSYDYHPTRPLTDHEVESMKAGKGIHVRYVPGTYRPLANKDNDYLMNREAQKAGRTFSGVEGIGMQDASLQESMGPICDRTKENLVGTDNGIIMARHRLLRAAKALVEKGVTPPGVNPEHHKVRQAALLLPRDVHYKEGAKEALKAKKGVRQTSV